MFCTIYPIRAVMQWIRGRSKPGKDDGEIALDVRTDLVQAKDILVG